MVSPSVSLSLWALLGSAVFLETSGDYESEIRYANPLAGFLIRSCMYGFGISSVGSTFDRLKKDRRWEMDCRRIGSHGDETCTWTYDFVNDFGERVDYNCEKNHYIAGLYSDYDEITNDRKWRIECCNSPRVLLRNCTDSNWANSFGQTMKFQIPSSGVLRGLHSYFDERAGDRRWRFTVCDIKRREKPPRFNDHTRQG